MECWLERVPGRVLGRLVGYLGTGELRALGRLSWDAEREAGLLAGLRQRWRALEALEEAEASLELDQLPVEGREDQFRWEDLLELRDKCHDGLDVLAEHAEDAGLAWARRWELELGLLAKVEEGLRLLRRLIAHWPDRDPERLAAQERRLRFTISLLDSHYGTAHLAFLAAFLDANPAPPGQDLL